ncbi:MAG: hypothetical protein IPN67_06775 [Bacteroidales bacterium]|nr:hypothetical protein [Bacteroidales bacterium]
MKKIFKKLLPIGTWITIGWISITAVSAQALWDTAKKNREVLTISTLFIAQDVRDFLSTPAGLDNAVKWCKETGITKVFIESFRGAYYADRDAMVNARDRFLKEGFEVAGCVTTVGVGKPGSGGWGMTSCYTSKATLDEMEKIFKFTASVFDVIMIDDFLFTECECEDCIAARGDQTWSKSRCDIMVNMSRENILKPARAVNPKVKIIIKYPLWYDSFHERGYEVVRESKDYDYTWIGTETRDYDYDVRPGGEVQYNAYFISRWINKVSGGKNGGGWVDALGVTPKIYLEQARQTVLGNEREIMLFHYGSLLEETNEYDDKPGTPIADVDAFRKELPGLFVLAGIVKDKPINGIHLPKLPNSEPLDEKYIFSFLGMLGLPLVPDDQINTYASSAIFTVHALKEPGLSGKLQVMLNAGKPVVITDGLAKLLANQSLLKNKNLTVLKVEGDPKKLLKLSREELKPLRDKLLAPMGMKFDAPNKVSLYLIDSNYIVIENFNDIKVDMTLELPVIKEVKKVLMLPDDGNMVLANSKNSINIRELSPRTLIVLQYK